MFIGHFAVGFAAKKVAAKPSLGTYFLAAQFLDLLWPSLLLLGVEKAAISNDAANPIPLSFTHYPVSHSLLMVLLWSILVGLIYWLFTKNKKDALVLGTCVLSHWFLDLLVHIPDLPLSPGASSVYRLGLWKMKAIELLIEIFLFTVGAVLYFYATKARNKTGTYAAVALTVFLLLIHFLNAFGPPPDSVKAVAWAGQLQWLIVAWGYWVDRNRATKGLHPQEDTTTPTGSVTIRVAHDKQKK